MSDRTSAESGYERAYQQSIESPENFWGDAAATVSWERKWKKVLENSQGPFYRWFEGGIINTCHNCLDIHVDEGND